MRITARTWIPALLLACAATANAEDLSSYTGAQLFQKLCASCHGPQGHGDGAVAASFKISPPDLTRIAARHGGQFDRDRIRQFIDGTAGQAAHGTRTMPVWGLELRAAQMGPDGSRNEPDAIISLLVNYLAGIQKR